MSKSRWLTPMRGGTPAVRATPNVAVIVGTRPEVIKMAPVVRALRASTSVTCTVVSTGQHRDLLVRAFEDVGLVPDIELSLMTENQSPSAFVARCITALDEVFAQNVPHAVLVQGDTSSACAGAMAATWRSIPVGHVKPGCARSTSTSRSPRNSIVAWSAWRRSGTLRPHRRAATICCAKACPCTAFS
jgi:UDP-N-acetylglucosamine 2-epimerase (non-hydrolysing)